jgi:hypothetical protein
MPELEYEPVKHDHATFPAKAKARKGFNAAYDSLALEHDLLGQLLEARIRAGLTQDAAAGRMGTT